MRILACVRLTEDMTAGRIWRYAGLDPSRPGPFNPRLLAFLFAQAKRFPEADTFLGRVYRERRRAENASNPHLEIKQLEARARRYTLTRFLTLWFEAAYRLEFGCPPRRSCLPPGQLQMEEQIKTPEDLSTISRRISESPKESSVHAQNIISDRWEVR